MLKCIAIFCLFVAVAFSATGIDVSETISLSDFQCFKQKGFTYAIVRCYRSSGHVDPSCASNAANAIKGGLTEVDVYVFPCPKCGNGASQINDTVAYIQQHNVKFGTMWLDIEGPQYWSSTTANVAFFKEMVSAAQAHNVKVGVYTSKSQWTPIMGSSTAGSSFPLWYAHYDNSQSFSDFQPFGGWSKPTMKQFNGNQNACSAGADYNWMPGGPNGTTTGPATSGTSGKTTGGPTSGKTTGHATSTGKTTGHGTSSGKTSGPSSTSGGPSSTSGNASSTSNGPSSTSGGPSSTSGNSSTSNGPSSTSGGPSSTGNSSTSATSVTSSTGYSNGMSSTNGDIKLSEDSIFNKIGGGKGSPRQKTKIDVMVEEMELIAEKDNHFQLSEEKMSKKFF